LTRRERIFWLVIGAVFVVGFVFLIPACNQGDQQGHDAQQQQCPGNKVAFIAIRQLAEFLDVHNWLVTALFAGLVTLFTWRLWQATNELRVSTDKLWDAGERQLELAAKASAAQSRDMQASIAASKKLARASARSAKVAEDALFIGQRPHIFVTEPRFRESVKATTFDPMGPPLWPLILVPTENHGKTPAVITEVCLESLCVASLPDVPDYRENRVYDELRAILGEGKTRVGTYVFKTEITPQAVNDILIGTSGPMGAGNGRNLYAFGYIKYDDIFDYENTVGFCWRYDMIAGRFYPEEHKAYNYRKVRPKMIRVGIA
jgi:hypothetical protein